MRLIICLCLMFFINSAYSQNQAVNVDYSKYIQKYLVLLKKSPNSYYYHTKIAYFYSLSGKYKNAEEHYLTAIKFKNSTIEARLGLCLVYAYQSKEKEVEELAKTILKADRFNYYGHIYLAGTYQRQKMFKESEATLKKILSVYPSDATLLEQLKNLYLAYGHTDSAEQVTKLLGEISDQ